jgi:hypothetical protein
MNRYNIIKGFLSGADLDLVQQWDSMAPDRFISSPWVMKAGDPAPAVLRKAYEAGRFGLVSAGPHIRRLSASQQRRELSVALSGQASHRTPRGHVWTRNDAESRMPSGARQPRRDRAD